MKNKKLILTAAAACSALILASSIAPAFAYVSTYERALGGYTIHLDRNETPVTTLTPEFVSGTPALFRANGVDIYLHANWEEQK